MTPHRAAIVLVLVSALAFYMWTAYTSAPFNFTSQNSDIYNQLTTAFLHGHTYLPIKPPPGLLHLSNPYDPAQNAPYNPSYHDLSLRNGHFYSPWGPTPALTLFLPFRLTTLKMSESFAAALFAFVGLACAVALLHVLVRRLLPDTPSWLLVVGSAALALTNVAPFALRRPAQYEVAITSGYCFEMAGILLIVTAVFAPRLRRRYFALGSLCLGLAVGGRVSLAPGGAVAVAAALYVIRRRKERLSVLIPALAPFVLCGLLLAAYNAVRFGSVMDFGTSYQLAGLNQMTMPANQLAYLPPGLFSYLLLPPRLALTFPHVFLMTSAEYPGPFPAGYAGAPGGWPTEPTGGLLPTMPITFLLLLLPVLWRRHSRAERPAVLAATGFTGLGLTIVATLSLALWATTQRYEVDYASFFLLAGFVVWALLMGRCAKRTLARRSIALAGIALACFGGAVGTAVSFTGYYDVLRLTHPGIFRTLEDITSPFATLATMLARKAVIARLEGPLAVDVPTAGYGTFDEGGAGTWLGAGPVTVTALAPSEDYLVLTADARPGPGAPAHAPLAVSVQSPGQRAITVPVVAGYVRLPVSLHWGLNRINVEFVGPAGPSPEVLYLGHMALGR